MKPQEFIEKYTLIDCRYPYEYKGGHIKVSKFQNYPFLKNFYKKLTSIEKKYEIFQSI